MNQEEENNPPHTSSVPQNDPSKAMNSKQEVEDANDGKINQDFRGYLPKEDMMGQQTGNHRVDMDVENLPNSNNLSGVSQRFGDTSQKAKEAMTPQPGLGNDDLGLKAGTEGDVTDDDLAVLNSTNDEIGTPQNISNEDLNTDLDIPGSELDDDNEEIGEEDEENNYYSLGGDNHDNLEEDKSSVSGS